MARRLTATLVALLIAAVPLAGCNGDGGDKGGASTQKQDKPKDASQTRGGY